MGFYVGTWETEEKKLDPRSDGRGPESPAWYGGSVGRGRVTSLQPDSVNM